MRKILFLLLTGCGLAAAAVAQVVIQPAIPVTGMLQKSQLWNLVVVNSSSAPIEGRVELIVRNRQTGLEVFSATTAKCTLPKGTVSLNVHQLNPVQYNLLGAGGMRATSEFLPCGSFTACYSFHTMPEDKPEDIGEECVAFDTEPLAPPMLIFPADSTTEDSSPALFSWTPPAPAAMLQQPQYELLITEIKEGQQASEAIVSNTPFFTTANLSANQFSYGAALPAFEKEKWYAWQVVARDGDAFAGKSEVWVFSRKTISALELLIKGTPYLRMQPAAAETGIAPNGILKLVFFNRGNAVKASLRIKDVSDETNNRKIPEVPLQLQPGENQLQVPLKKWMPLTDDHTYEAELVLPDGERNRVLFIVKHFSEK